MHWLTDRMAIIFLIFLGLVVWGNTIFNPFFINDDEDQIINHVLIRDVRNIPTFFTGSTYYQEQSQTQYGLYYRPMMQTAYSLLYAVHGPDPLIYHFFQLGVVIANAVLVYSFMKKFFSPTVTFITSSIFLVHPVTSEVVLYAANLQDALCFFFGISALLVTSTSIYRKGVTKVAIALLLLLSLLSKESGIVFVGIVLLYDYIFSKKHAIMSLILSVAVIGIYLLLRVGMARLPFNSGDSIAIIAHLSLADRLLSLPKILTTYITSYFYPVNISIAQFWIVKSINMNNLIIHLTSITTVIVILSILCIRKWNINILKKLYIFSIGWIVLSMIPYTHIISLDATYAERWFYPATAGLTVLMVTLWLEFTYTHKILQKFGTYIAVIVVLVFSFRSWARTFDWRDAKTLLQADIPKSENNYFMQNLLGAVYIREQNYDAAKPYISSSIATYPFVGNLSNMGIIALHQKDYGAAKEFFRRARGDRQLYSAHRNYANFLEYIVKDYPEALKISDESLKLYPKSGDLWLIKAQAEYELGKKEEALHSIETASTLLDTVMAKDVLLTIREGRKLDVEKYLDKE